MGSVLALLGISNICYFRLTFCNYIQMCLCKCVQVWEDMRGGTMSPSEGASQLCEARDMGTLLSSQSLDFIILEVCLSVCIVRTDQLLYMAWFSYPTY